MAAYIGAVEFRYPLHWVNKGEPVVLGSDTRTRSGNLVMLRSDATQTFIEARCVFHYESMATVQALMNYWKSGLSFSADLEDSETSVTIRFSAKNGVVNVKHETWGDDLIHAHIEGQPTDLYTGEINLIIEA